MNELVWVVPGEAWPSQNFMDDLTLDEVFDVLDQFDDHYESALRSLENQSVGA